MTKDVVSVRFPNMEKTYYAIYWSYNGKILDWIDLDDVMSLSIRETLPEDVRQQIDARCEGTALFETKEIAHQVIEAIEKS